METYLCAVQSDVEQKNTVKNLFIGKFVLRQEVGQTCFIAILSYGHASYNNAVSAIFFTGNGYSHC